MNCSKQDLQRTLSVWHPGDRVAYGGKHWYFTAYMKNGTLEQWVRPELPECWTVIPPVSSQDTDLDRARLAGPDRNHLGTMYRLLADMQLPLLKTSKGRWTVDGTTFFDRPQDAIYTHWLTYNTGSC